MSHPVCVRSVCVLCAFGDSAFLSRCVHRFNAFGSCVSFRLLFFQGFGWMMELEDEEEEELKPLLCVCSNVQMLKANANVSYQPSSPRNLVRSLSAVNLHVHVHTAPCLLCCLCPDNPLYGPGLLLGCAHCPDNPLYCTVRSRSSARPVRFSRTLHAFPSRHNCQLQGRAGY